MPTTKSGVSTPADAPKQKLEVPVKVYPGSSKLGHGTMGNTVSGPASKK